MRMRYLVPILTVALLAGMLASIAKPQRAYAAVEDYRPATYNMQGSGNKWTTDIPQIIRSGYNVISLQEAGAQPPGHLNWTSGWLGGMQNWNGWRVQLYNWRPPGQSQDWYIAFVRTDFSGNQGTNGGRVNLAVLTREYPSHVDVIPGPFWANNGLPTSRPALGVTVGGHNRFYTVHALASGGNDGQGLLLNIRGAVGSDHWAAMGDWNREPNTLVIQRGMHKYTPNDPTHFGVRGADRELDYMVSNDRIAGYGGVVHGYGSDHMAVGFRRLAANADVELLNAHDGNRQLGVPSKTMGVQVVNGGYSDWRFKPMGSGLYSIVNRTTGACWSDNNGRIIQWGCNGAADQLFDMDYWSDSGQIKIKPKNRNTCVGDDSNFGWGSQILTTMSCSKGEARFNFRFDWDPGPNAPLVVF